MSLKHQLYLGFAITSQTDQKIPTFGRHHTGPNCELPLRFTKQMFKLLIHAGKVPLLNKIKQTYDHIMSSLSLQRSLRKIMSKRNGIFEPYISFTFFTPKPPPTPTPKGKPNIECPWAHRLVQWLCRPDSEVWSRPIIILTFCLACFDHGSQVHSSNTSKKIRIHNTFSIVYLPGWLIFDICDDVVCMCKKQVYT